MSHAEVILTFVCIAAQQDIREPITEICFFLMLVFMERNLLVRSQRNKVSTSLAPIIDSIEDFSAAQLTLWPL